MYYDNYFLIVKNIKIYFPTFQYCLFGSTESLDATARPFYDSAKTTAKPVEWKKECMKHLSSSKEYSYNGGVSKPALAYLGMRRFL